LVVCHWIKRLSHPPLAQLTAFVSNRYHFFTKSHQAAPIATKPSHHLPQSFFARPAEQVAPELIGCLLVKRQAGELLWGVIVETEAYSQDEPACHGYRRRSPSNETLFGEPGRFYVYVSYGIHHCVKRAVPQKTSIWA
jgi:DNA-3-methyladenine glycosylase